jgi:hypothetical protein
VSDSKETALLGYIAGVAFLSIFFWFTLGDAYGRFMIAINPANSLMSGELEYYTGGATGLVCLVAPFLLAYLPRYVIGEWMLTGWEYSARASLWTLDNGKKLAVSGWRHASGAIRTLWETVSGKLDEHRK